MTNININTLPEEVQNKIKSRLRAYDEVDVYFEYGEYHFGLVLKAEYAPDHKVIGTYYAKDIFTEDERIENYMNEFHEYAPNYKGKRDYRALNAYETNHKGEWNLKLVNGSFEF